MFSSSTLALRPEYEIREICNLEIVADKGEIRSLRGDYDAHVVATT